MQKQTNDIFNKALELLDTGMAKEQIVRSFSGKDAAQVRRMLESVTVLERVKAESIPSPELLKTILEKLPVAPAEKKWMSLGTLGIFARFAIPVALAAFVIVGTFGAREVNKQPFLVAYFPSETDRAPKSETTSQTMNVVSSGAEDGGVAAIDKNPVAAQSGPGTTSESAPLASAPAGNTQPSAESAASAMMAESTYAPDSSQSDAVMASSDGSYNSFSDPVYNTNF